MSWALYDWANSGFFAVILTFVFPAYFARQIAENETLGTTLWGNTVGLAGLAIAIAAPIVGAVADQGGRRKLWLAACTLACALPTALLWWVTPGSDAIVPVLLLAGVAIIGGEFAFVFYNAMLPSLTSFDRVGRWSGWAWGLGYAGGIGCLIVALFGFVVEDAWFPLPRAEAQHVRATFVLTAVWYLVFALPLFLFTPDEPAQHKGLRRAIRDGIGQLRESIRHLRDYAAILRFLVARIFFIDGLATIFAFGGVYAAGTFAMTEEQVLLFGIALNLTAGVGAVTFAWVDDWLGSKRTILVSLLGLIVPGTMLLLVDSVAGFWLCGMLVGIFVGPVQAAGRSYLARAAPRELRNQMFGLFVFSGKATAFAGPLLVGWVTAWFGSQRAGMSVIIVLLGIGFLLMLTVPEAPRSDTESGEAGRR
jgi:UMF1 family MFS transporter